MDISNTTHRVGTPSLRPLPLYNDHEYAQTKFSRGNIQYATEIALRILTVHGITRPADPIYNVDPPSRVPVNALASWEPEDMPEDDAHIMVTTRTTDSTFQDESAKRLTLLITADWDESSSPSNWPFAVREIKKACDNSFDGKMQLDIEMIATHLTRRKYIGPVLANTDLEKKWKKSILDKVIETLTRMAKEDSIVFVGLCRLGFNAKLAKNPITVYIAVDHECPEAEWPAMIGGLRSIPQFPPSFDICIENNDVTPLTLESLNRTPRPEPEYEEQVHLGADLCAAQYQFTVEGGHERVDSRIGTMGCHLEIKNHHDSRWRKLALTNYHVARTTFTGFQRPLDKRQSKRHSKRRIVLPGQETFLGAVDVNGLVKEGWSSLTPEHSSNRTMEQLGQRLSSIKLHLMHPKQPVPQEPMEISIADQITCSLSPIFLDLTDTMIGDIVASSGYSRTIDSQRMNWALIDNQHDYRRGANNLPKLTDWEDTSIHPDDIPSHARAQEQTQLQQPAFSLKSMKDGAMIWKFEAASGPTFGTFNGYQALYGRGGSSKHTNARASREYTCLSLDTPESVLAIPGDSGSVAYDQNGCAVGLICGAINPRQTSLTEEVFPPDSEKSRQITGFVLVTPIEGIFEDIKKFIGIEDIGVAQ